MVEGGEEGEGARESCSKDSGDNVGDAVGSRMERNVWKSRVVRKEGLLHRFSTAIDENSLHTLTQRLKSGAVRNLATWGQGKSSSVVVACRQGSGIGKRKLTCNQTS